MTVVAEAHPLFPAPDEDGDPPRVCSIHIQRNGETYPAKFAPEQLTELEQIAAAWGGGRYTLIARDERRITAQVTYQIPGKSKPFVPEGELEQQSAAPAPLAHPPATSDAMAILTFVSQQQSNSMQMMLQMSQHQSEMMLAMMRSQSEAQLAHQREMAQMHERASARDAQMFAAMLGRANQADPQQLFMSGVQTAQALTTIEHARTFEVLL